MLPRQRGGAASSREKRSQPPSPFKYCHFSIRHVNYTSGLERTEELAGTCDASSGVFKDAKCQVNRHFQSFPQYLSCTALKGYFEGFASLFPSVLQFTFKSKPRKRHLQPFLFCSPSHQPAGTVARLRSGRTAAAGRKGKHNPSRQQLHLFSSTGALCCCQCLDNYGT